MTQNFPPKIGGIQTVMFSIARDLASMGHEVHVFPDHYFIGIDSFKAVSYTHLTLPTNREV